MFKKHYIFFLIFFSVIIVVFIPVFDAYILHPLYKDAISRNVTLEAIRMGNHIMRILHLEAKNMNTDFLQLETGIIGDIKKNLSIEGLKVFSSSGKTIFSTKPEQLGNVNKNKYFHDIVAKGNIHTQIVEKGGATLEGQILEANVVETYLPIIVNGKFLGALEIYYDVTDRYELYRGITLKAFIIEFCVGLVFVILIVFMSYKTLRLASNKLRIEKLLDEEKTKALQYLNISAVIFLVLDSAQRVILINKKGCEILGYKENEIIGKNWFDNFLPNEIRDKVKAVFEMLMSGETEVAEYNENPVLTKSGENKVISWHNTVIKNEAGVIINILSSGEDITERKKVEVKYKTIIDTTIDGFWIVDTEGNILDVNKAYSNLVSYNRDELLKMNIKDIEIIESRDEINRHIQKVITIGYDRFETQHRRKDGKIVDIEVSVNYMDIDGGRFIVFHRDITERKLTEKLVMEREMFLSDILFSIQDNICVTDTELNILQTNSSMEKLFANRMPLVGRKCYEAFKGLSKPCESCPTCRTLKTGKAENEIITLNNEDGEIIGWYDVYSYPLKDLQSNKLKGVIEYGRNITDRKRMEDEILRSKKLSSLGKMLAGVSHEIKNPLLGILMILQSLESTFNVKDTRCEDITRVVNEIIRLEKLLDTLMSFVKPRSLSLLNIDIRETIELSLSLVNQGLKNKNIRVKKYYSHNGKKILVNEDKMQQVFINILLNAIEAMDNDGILSIYTYEINNGKTIATKADYADLSKCSTMGFSSGIIVRIKDSGRGIKNETLDKIFDPFYSTKDNKSGLGLYISYEIIDQHKGVINVNSKEGFGTTFCITLPDL